MITADDLENMQGKYSMMLMQTVELTILTGRIGSLSAPRWGMGSRHTRKQDSRLMSMRESGHIA